MPSIIITKNKYIELFLRNMLSRIIGRTTSQSKSLSDPELTQPLLKGFQLSHE